MLTALQNVLITLPRRRHTPSWDTDACSLTPISFNSVQTISDWEVAIADCDTSNYVGLVILREGLVDRLVENKITV